MSYLVFDLEVENHVVRKRLGSPFGDVNYVVARGWKKQGDKQASWEYFNDPVMARKSYLRIPEDVTLLVGFNIKFDLLWEMRLDNPDLKAFFERGGAVWCGQYAEYLLNAQQEKYQMASMDDTAPEYGGTHKHNMVKELWENGAKTSEIQEDMLIDYLVGTVEEGRDAGDIGNTEKIFLGQLKKSVQAGMLKAIRLRMDGLCATTDMEYNGLKVDVAEAKRRAKELEAELVDVSAKLQTFLPELPEGLEFNWGSNAHKSCLIFGGSLGYKKRAPWIDPTTGDWARYKAFEVREIIGDDGRPLRYLSGKKKDEIKTQRVEVPGEIKIKYQDYSFEIPGYTYPLPEWKSSLTDAAGNNLWSVDKDTIEELATRDIPFCQVLTRHSAISKELGTYYITTGKDGKLKGMLTCVSPHDHIIHHNLNHCITITSRLSSSEPNLQNIPTKGKAKSQVKNMFVSRFTVQYCLDHGLLVPNEYTDLRAVVGKMLEADYSQLEVVIQGMLSGDENLCQALRDRVDFHCKRVAAKFNMSYEDALDWCKNPNSLPPAPYDHDWWKTQRQLVKEFSFQRAYGAGAAAISYATGIPVEDVKALIEAEEILFPGVVAYNSRVEQEVLRNATAFRDPVRGWRTFRRGYYRAPTGCLYSFRSWDAPDFLRKKGILDSFSPPELKNYPVQGTGGEVVQLVLGKLWRNQIATRNYNGMAFLCNTVHDCVWLDYHPHIEYQLVSDVKRIMEAVPQYLTEEFDMEVTVPFPVEVEVGRNMNNLSHPTTH